MAKKIVKKEALVEEVKPVVVKSLDLKESLEMVKGVSLLLEGIMEVMADGKIGFDDATVLLELAKKYEVFTVAVKDAGLIPAELKDLDETEIVALGLAIYPLLKKMKDLVLKIKG